MPTLLVSLDVFVMLPTGAAAVARESITGAVTSAGTQPQHLEAAVLSAARETFNSGLHVVAAITVVALSAVGILIATGLRQIPALDQAEAPSDT